MNQETIALLLALFNMLQAALQALTAWLESRKKPPRRAPKRRRRRD